TTEGAWEHPLSCGRAARAETRASKANPLLRGLSQPWVIPAVGYPRRGLSQPWVIPGVGYPRCGLSQPWVIPGVGYPRCGLSQTWVIPDVGYPRCGLSQPWVIPAIGYPRCGLSQPWVIPDIWHVAHPCVWAVRIPTPAPPAANQRDGRGEGTVPPPQVLRSPRGQTGVLPVPCRGSPSSPRQGATRTLQEGGWAPTVFRRKGTQLAGRLHLGLL
uniref:Uncharacterized protein n=1 Tax=Athene cunicularia TaxID=194338 RepID=A0A663M0R1_ATHCN